jgi:hypothetical protein
MTDTAGRQVVALLYQSWEDLDHAAGGLTAEEAGARHDGASAIAWTVGHVTQMLDSWIPVRFAGGRPHSLFSQPRFRTGGSGEADDWPAILGGVREVRAAARRFLDDPALDLDRVVQYDGSIVALRGPGLQLRYALLRIAAHHFVHAGEIAAVRSRLGHALPDDRDWGQRLLQQ